MGGLYSMVSFKKVFKINHKLFAIYGILGLFAACSGMKQSEQEKLRRQNAKGEFIYRNHDEYHYVLKTPEHRIREKYPWEMASGGKHPKISKESLPCKSSNLNLSHLEHKDPTPP